MPNPTVHISSKNSISFSTLYINQTPHYIFFSLLPFLLIHSLIGVFYLKMAILSLKVVLASTAIISIALLVKLTVPIILHFIVSEAPLLWGSLLAWLTPPYLYVVVNGIIITIAASSRFHNNFHGDHSDPVVAPLKVPLPVDSPLDFSVSNGFESVVLKKPAEIRSDFGEVITDFKVLEKKGYREEKIEVEKVNSVAPVPEVEDDGFMISRSTWTPTRLNEIPKSYSPDKPLVSVRFGHRKTPKASPEAGRGLGVAKPKRHDTLESTWKTITDGRPIPLARHLKKSDTWETHGRQNHTAAAALEQHSPKMKKCEIFNKPPSTSLSPSPGSGKLRKEASLSHDELNRRVEAFIKKFNEEMRLQRQESLNQYKTMVYRR